MQLLKCEVCGATMERERILGICRTCESARYTRKRLYRGKGTPHNPTFYYELIDITNRGNGLLDRYVDAQKSDGGNQTFTKEGAFHSEGSLNRANGPWLWEPKQLIDTVEKGLMWNNPAKLAKQMFKPSGKEFSTIYLKKMTDKA